LSLSSCFSQLVLKSLIHKLFINIILRLQINIFMFLISRECFLQTNLIKKKIKLYFSKNIQHNFINLLLLFSSSIIHPTASLNFKHKFQYFFSYVCKYKNTIFHKSQVFHVRNCFRTKKPLFSFLFLFLFYFL